MALLTVKDLGVIYGTQPIIEGVNFDLNEGDIALIVGPNGAGKTTLLRAIAKLTPHSGSVSWSRKIKIGFVPQKLDFERSLPLTVRELFGIVLGFRDRTKIIEALEFSKAEHLLDQRLGQLSGGELQRVLIAFVLAEGPDVLLFDEPLSGIDIGGEETIYQHLVHTVKVKKLTVLMVSHDLSVVFRLASKVICLNKTVRCVGAPRDIRDEALQDLYGGEVALFPHGDHRH